MKTTILPIDSNNLGHFTSIQPLHDDLLHELHLELDDTTPDAQHLRLAAKQLRSSNVPVAFGTETVYGLGADATRSEAVLGIYKAKSRPSDNPLIVHVASLRQLRSLLRHGDGTNSDDTDPIPPIYHSLIAKFWPGPLTILLPNPPNSPLAPEVTAGLSTFGARMPRHAIALALIQLADVPVAAPSANASTKPSPTAAEHVAFDLNGRIETILDSGPCDVGVESTVVDGLSSPPLILRPGGISIEQLRQCPGWEDVQVGYKNTSEAGSKPKAPGMKYRHYSPNAPVILFEAGVQPPSAASLVQHVGERARLGIVRTKHWAVDTTETESPIKKEQPTHQNGHRSNKMEAQLAGIQGLIQTLGATKEPLKTLQSHRIKVVDVSVELLELELGQATADIARGVFAALRDLDRHNVDAILVEGIDDEEGDTAAAVMNRLRKAAEINVSG